jgi:hypothetical protein
VLWANPESKSCACFLALSWFVQFIICVWIDDNPLLDKSQHARIFNHTQTIQELPPLISYYLYWMTVPDGSGPLGLSQSHYPPFRPFLPAQEIMAVGRPQHSIGVHCYRVRVQIRRPGHCGWWYWQRGVHRQGTCPWCKCRDDGRGFL